MAIDKDTQARFRAIEKRLTALDGEPEPDPVEPVKVEPPDPRDLLIAEMARRLGLDPAGVAASVAPAPAPAPAVTYPQPPPAPDPSMAEEWAAFLASRAAPPAQVVAPLTAPVALTPPSEGPPQPEGLGSLQV